MLIIYLSCLIGSISNTLWVEKPESLKNQLGYFNNHLGGLEYSMSTFGAIPYEE